MYSGSPPSVQQNASHLRIAPRSGKLKPMTQAIQQALFRVDKGDTVPRINKLGELIVRKAMGGDNDMIKLVFERMDGKAMPVDDKGNEVDLHGATLTALVTLLTERKTDAAKVVDVVATMVDKKREE